MRQFDISRKSKEQREEKLSDVDYSVLKNTDFCYIPYLCIIQYYLLKLVTILFIFR